MISQNLPYFSTCQTVAETSVEEIQAVGLSRRKAMYVQRLARQIVSGKLDLESLKANQSADEIISKFDVIRGIGVLIAELTMLRRI